MAKKLLPLLAALVIAALAVWAIQFTTMAVDTICESRTTYEYPYSGSPYTVSYSPCRDWNYEGWSTEGLRAP